MHTPSSTFGIQSSLRLELFSYLSQIRAFKPKMNCTLAKLNRNKSYLILNIIIAHMKGPQTHIQSLEMFYFFGQIKIFIWKKSVSWEFGCNEEYLKEFNKGKFLRYYSLLALLPRTRLDPLIFRIGVPLQPILSVCHFI